MYRFFHLSVARLSSPCLKAGILAAIKVNVKEKKIERIIELVQSYQLSVASKSEDVRYVYLLHPARNAGCKACRNRRGYRRRAFSRRKPRRWTSYHRSPGEENQCRRHSRPMGRMRPDRFVLQSRGYLYILQWSLDAPLRYAVAQR